MLMRSKDTKIGVVRVVPMPHDETERHVGGFGAPDFGYFRHAVGHSYHKWPTPWTFAQLYPVLPVPRQMSTDDAWLRVQRVVALARKQRVLRLK